MSANAPSSSGMGASISTTVGYGSGMGASSSGDGSQQQCRSFPTRSSTSPSRKTWSSIWSVRCREMLRMPTPTPTGLWAMLRCAQHPTLLIETSVALRVAVLILWHAQLQPMGGPLQCNADQTLLLAYSRLHVPSTPATNACSLLCHTCARTLRQSEASLALNEQASSACYSLLLQQIFLATTAYVTYPFRISRAVVLSDDRSTTAFMCSVCCGCCSIQEPQSHNTLMMLASPDKGAWSCPATPLGRTIRMLPL